MLIMQQKRISYIPLILECRNKGLLTIAQLALSIQEGNLLHLTVSLPIANKQMTHEQIYDIWTESEVHFIRIRIEALQYAQRKDSMYEDNRIIFVLFLKSSFKN